MKSFWISVAYLAATYLAVPVPHAIASMEIVPSIAAVDESDDILKPAIGLKSYINGIGFSVWGWGRDFGPVQQRSVLLTGGKYWTPFSFKSLMVGGGISALSETTRLTFKDARDENHEDTFYNAGGFFGLRYSYSFSGVIVDASWESGIFPAGLAGGLFLATGRKQIVSIGMGAML
jgi:hypothetical protein